MLDINSKILITLRHPGPTHAIAAVMPEIEKIFHSIVLVLSDTAIEIMGKQYRNLLSNKKVYLVDIDGRISKISDPYSKDFLDLISKIEKIIEAEKPNRILRTTPASGYGVDEAVTRAANRIGYGKRVRCYQEIYDCGKDLNLLKTPVGVVDIKAAQILKQKGIHSRVIGWLNQGVFQDVITYSEARETTRQQLQIARKEEVILYCTVASGNDEAEQKHFYQFIAGSEGRRVFVKFHPRNTESYKVRFFSKKYSNVEIINGLSIESVLSFADYIVSPGSAINLDCLQYQIVSGLQSLKTISVYTDDKYTKAILKNVFGYEHQPYIQQKMGSIIMGSINNAGKQLCITEALRKEHFQEACEMFGIPFHEALDNFIQYIVEE